MALQVKEETGMKQVGGWFKIWQLNHVISSFQLLDNGMHYTLFLFISSITVIFYYTLYSIIN